MLTITRLNLARQLRLLALRPDRLQRRAHGAILLRKSPTFAEQGPRLGSLTFQSRYRSTSILAKATSSSPGDRGASRRQSWLPSIIKRVLKWAARVALVSAILVAALPTILSTKPGIKAGSWLASRFTDGVVHIDEADLGWRKPVKLRGTEYRLPASLGGDVIASADVLHTRSSLWDVVVGRAYNVFAEKPWVDCSFAPSGSLKWTELSKHAAGKALNKQRLVVDSGYDGVPKPPSLVAETSEIKFTAEAKILTASLHVPNGIMRVPREVREVIGQDLHIIAVLGSTNLREVSEELELDTEWALTDLPSQAGHVPLESSSESNPPSERNDAQSTASSTSEPWLFGPSYDPGTVSVRSENLKLEGSGWRRRLDGAFLLRKPGTLEFEYTPALAEYVLGRLSPLLSGVLAVEDGKVVLDVTPENMISPAENYHIRINPLRVAVNRQGMLATAIDFLRLKGDQAVRKTSLLQGVTSAIHVDLNDDGGLISDRIDVLISAGGKSTGVHLCSWGKLQSAASFLDVNLGVPADTLRLIGMKGVADNEMLVVPVKGSHTRPNIDWKGAYKRLASLAASHTADPKSLRGTILQGIVQSLDMRANAPGLETGLEIPQPVERLPWKDDASILHDRIVPQD